MGDLVKSGGNGLVGLFHGKGGELSIPKPFEKDIFLFDTYVAGTTHIEGIEELEPHLNNDDRLEFFREPDNRYDKQAIVIKTVEVEETTKGGLILTGSAKEKPQVAQVIAVGPGGVVDGKEVKMTVKVGDKVLTSKYSGTEVKVDGEECTIVRQSDILAVVED